MDMLALEGFDFRPDTGTIVKDDLTPYIIRQKINAALQENVPWRAYQLLDTYLGKLDRGSGDWFADGSPGNILREESVRNYQCGQPGSEGQHAADALSGRRP